MVEISFKSDVGEFIKLLVEDTLANKAANKLFSDEIFYLRPADQRAL